MAGGRWSLVRGLLPSEPVPPTVQALARVEVLLGRYGIVGRACVAAEEIPGGFGPLYRVLGEMEEKGRVRRGYFVEGLGGAQFASAGAVDRLRGDGDDEELRVGPDEVRILAAMDPANPYGALAPWPETGAGEPSVLRRVPGAWIFLARGRPLLYLAPRGRNLMTFPAALGAAEGVLDAAVGSLRRLPQAGRRKSLAIERIDGRPAGESPLLAAFQAAGFGLDYGGLIDLGPRPP